MSEQEFGVKLDLAVGQARMLGMFEDWDDLADHAERQHAIGLVLDPTAYRAAMDRLTPMVDLA